MHGSPRVLIVQPYIPAYRVPLFSRLVEQLESMGIDMVVAAGSPESTLAVRSDARTGLLWTRELDQRNLNFKGVSLRWRKVGDVLAAFRPTHIIVEQALKNLDTYQILLRSRAAVAMWGHGRTYTAPVSKTEEKAKLWLTRRMSWFFSYTQGGREYLRTNGFAPERITVLGNSTDASALRADLRALDPQEIRDFQVSLGLSPGHSALFLGGLDSRKGLSFLMSAAEIVRRQIPDFVLMLGGAGEMESELQALQDAGAPIRLLGRIDGREKAVALSASQILAVPEWVGLIAVDSLASGVPIVTTDYEYHAPEFEYLRPGHSCVVAKHDANDYANEIVRLLEDPMHLRTLADNGVRDGLDLSIENMSQSFAAGIRSWVNTFPR